MRTILLGRLTCREGRMLYVTLCDSDTRQQTELTTHCTDHSERLKVIGKVGVRSQGNHHHSLILRQEIFYGSHISYLKQAGKLDQKVWCNKGMPNLPTPTFVSQIVACRHHHNLDCILFTLSRGQIEWIYKNKKRVSNYKNTFGAWNHRSCTLLRILTSNEDFDCMVGMNLTYFPF